MGDARLLHAGLEGEQPIERLLPGGQSVLDLKRVQSIEGVFSQPQPSAIRVMGVHHLAPSGDWQTKASLAVPRNDRDLQSRVGDVEDRATELQQQRCLPVVESGKVFRRCNVKIERARDGQFRSSFAGEGTNDGGCMRPQHSTQRLAPAVRFAEEIDQSSLFVSPIAAPVGFDHDLAAQHDAFDTLERIGIGDSQTKDQQRRRGASNKTK